MGQRRNGRRAAVATACAAFVAFAPMPTAVASDTVTIAVSPRSRAAHERVRETLRRNGFTITSDDGWTFAATGPRNATGRLRSEANVSGVKDRKPWRHRAIPAGGHTGPSLGNAYDVVEGDGTGITIATVQFSGWNKTDLSTYATAAGIAMPSVTEISVDTADPADTSSGGDFEVAMDQEILLAAAPKAAQRIYFAENSDDGALLVYSRIAADAEAGLVQVVSTSWGNCEPNVDLDPGTRAGVETHLARIVAAGATVFAASGDMGAYDCSAPDAPDNTLAVDWPAASPHVVGVGGTKLVGTTGAWAETAWNQPQAGTFKGYAGGGGESSSVPRPSWQSGIGIAGTKRLVPDVAAMADPSAGFAAYAASYNGWVLGGGTSAGAPLLAAHLASALSANGRTTGVGDIHDELYANPQAFRDVTVGSNLLYPATSGYDRATGLGAPRWSALSAALFGNPVVTTAAYTKTTTVPVSVTPVPGMTVTAWTAGEGTDLACDPAGSPIPPTSVTLTSGDRVTHVAVAALDDEGGCHVGVAPTLLDTKAPAVTTALKSLTGLDARTVFSWNATDASPASGVASYDVCVYAVGIGCSWTYTATTAKTVTLTLAQGRTYQLRVSAVDRAGNRSPQVRGSVYNVPIDERSFSRTTGWTAYPNRNDWFGSHALASRRGAAISKTLAGTRYEVFFVLHPAGGVADVYVGGRFVKRVNTYAPTTTYRRAVIVAAYTTRASRTVKVVALGTKDSRSRGTGVAVDAMRVAF